MNPRKRVLFIAAIFAVMGLGVSAAIIAIGGGFSGQGLSITNPPTQKDIWFLGKSIHEGTLLNYTLTSMTPRSSLLDSHASIEFVNDLGNKWKVRLKIENNTIWKEDDIFLSNSLTRDGPVDKVFKPYLDPLDSSILAIRDIAREPKYLIIGAPWDKINVGTLSISIKVTSKETLKTLAGDFDAYVLSFNLGEKESRIWVAHEVPLPVKAEVYDSNDNLQYKYEIIGLKK